ARVEDYIGADNPVRAIEGYVEALDFAKLGFRHAGRGVGVGQPPYDPADLLKLYLSQFGALLASSGAGGAAESGTDLAVEGTCARLPHDCDVSQGELGRAEGSKPQLCASRPRA